jgi:hypothetical protein
METPIITAIIAGSVAIVSPIITYVVTRMYDQRGLGKIKGRRRAMVGSWKGDIVQEIDGKSVSMNLEITFTAGKRVIEGTGEFISQTTNQVTRLKFTGGFYHEQFVKLDYANPDELIVQFGCSILKLSSDGRTLEGRYVGYGSLSDRIILGEVSLRRTA